MKFIIEEKLRMKVSSLAFLLLAGYMSAQEPGKLEISMIVEKEIIVENEEGEKEIRREPAVTVVPGDHVIYTIQYKNNSFEEADSVVINNPLPEQMVYIVGTAGGEGTEILFSIDGGTTFDAPENLIVIDEEGNQRPANAKDYTNIRWIMKDAIPPGKGGNVYYRAALL